jgi:ABC-type branched-subunit amino acid transport system ATPase component
LQATAVFSESTVLENVLVGVGLRRHYGGTFRTLFSTPRHRAETREARERARGALELVGLDWAADAPASELTGFDRRLLMVASAIATSPRALLLDEPAAGAATQDLDRLADLLLRLRDGGLALLLIEHNLRLVNATADRLTVLVAGRVAAAGRPDEVLRSAAVRDVYLGRRHGHG